MEEDKKGIEYVDEEELEEEETSPRRRGYALFITLFIGFFLVSLTLAYIYYQEMERGKLLIVELEDITIERDSLLEKTMELDSVINVLRGIIGDRDIRISQLQTKINNYMSEVESARFAKATAQKYKKQYEELEKEVSGLQEQVLGLTDQNRILLEKQKNLESRFLKEKNATEQVANQLDELNRKVNKVKVLNAVNVTANAYDKRNKEADKAKKVTKIKVCFTLIENPLIESGIITVYLRIFKARQVLASSADNVFMMNGEEVIYTAKSDVTYTNNVPVDECITWNSRATISPGTYNVELYANENKIGSSKLKLQ
jgi:uncharacterized protein YoxC